MGWRNRNRNADSVALITMLLIVLFIITCFSAWVTHIIVCLSNGLWGFLIAGALFFPIGIVHGIGYWFGFFHG